MAEFFRFKNMVLTIFILFSVLFFFTLFTQRPGWADNKTGKVIEIRNGKLECLTDGAWKQIKKGSAVSFGNKLKTDKTGMAVVELPDIGRLVIGPDSEIELGKEPKDFKGNLSRGALWLNAKLSKEGRASISTTLATAGVRGTKFTVTTDGKSFCACTCVGEVDVKTTGGKAVKLPAGEFYAFTEGEPLPEKPQSALPQLQKRSAAFDFCFNCHVVGGKGKLKRDWEKQIPA